MLNLFGVRRADPAPSSAAPTCATCGAARGGPYCAQCGQRALSGRHTLASVLGAGLGRILNLEHGFLHTADRLTRSPGRVVRDYLSGRTRPYSDPFGYLLISFAAFALLSEAVGSVGGVGGSGNRFFTLLLVPFVAGASRLLNRRARLTFAEHLVVAMYLCGHLVLLLTVLQLAVPLVEPATPQAAALMVAMLALGLAYVPWAYSRIFDDRPVLAAAVGLASLLGGLAVGLAAVLLLVRTLMALGMDGR